MPGGTPPSRCPRLGSLAAKVVLAGSRSLRADTGPAPRATVHGPRGVVWLFAVCAVAAVAALVVLLAPRRPALKAAPEPAPSLGSGASAGPATLVSTPMATPALVSPPTPVALPSLAPAATPAQTGAPTSRLTVASPPGSTLSTGAPGRSTARLEHANALFEARHYQSALNEAQALLARQPEDEEARALAEDARAALLVEEKLRMARAAVARGDRTVALTRGCFPYKDSSLAERLSARDDSPAARDDVARAPRLGDRQLRRNQAVSRCRIVLR